MSTPKVSIVIPVYNAEKYIERCVHTLFAQTLDDLEYIFVDDCSPDNSINVMLHVLEEYPNRKQQVKLIRHETNQGVSQSRQDGVDVATGEYIIHCDPDDWVELNMYDVMYDNAIANDADIVGCDFIEHHSMFEIIKRQPINQSSEKIVKNILLENIHSSLWSRLIRRLFIIDQGVKFMSGITVMEDMQYVVPLHLATKKTVYVPQQFYHYRMVNDSITHTLTLRHVDSALAVLNNLKQFFEHDSELYQSWISIFSNRAQSLITNVNLYDPGRWRKETMGLKLQFNSLKNQISPWLVSRHLDALNFWIIKNYHYYIK